LGLPIVGSAEGLGNQAGKPAAFREDGGKRSTNGFDPHTFKQNAISRNGGTIGIDLDRRFLRVRAPAQAKRKQQKRQSQLAS
jgi:hypothetical protein